ncbi:hypothetical protein BHM03_00030178 [Ensete ventricosum]|nr:hypothetical protein BHM03_00030178 [Ensete ventricosum]
MAPDTPPTAYCQGCCGLVGLSRSACRIASRPLSEVLQIGRPVAFGLPCCQPPAGRGAGWPVALALPYRRPTVGRGAAMLSSARYVAIGRDEPQSKKEEGSIQSFRRSFAK